MAPPPIREFFHFMQIVDDFDDAASRFDRLLAPQVYVPKHWSDFDVRWASLAVIGPEFVFELMEPGTKAEDLDKPLPKFYARHGEHLHSFSWFLANDDIPRLTEHLRANGVRVIEPYPYEDGRASTIFTHPKDTLGQLEFQGLLPGGSPVAGPHLKEDWTGAYWRDEHPTGIERTSHLTQMVSDMGRARKVFVELLGGMVFHEEITPDRESVFVVLGQAVPGREIAIELARPTTADSRLAQDLAAHGEMPHAMTFKVRDLNAVEKHVADCGFALLEDRTDDTITVDPVDLHNAVVSFTTRTLPNDPRR